MQIQVKDISNVKKQIDVEIPTETIKEEFDKGFRELNKTSKVKGFRPGKVPRSVLNRMFGKSVAENIRSKLVSDAYEKAMNDHDLKIIGEPQLNIPELKENEAYIFNIVVEVNPTIDFVDFKNLELTKPFYKIGEKEITYHLSLHQKQLATSESIEEDRSAQTGDIVVIDYEGFNKGQPFEETPKIEGFSIELGKMNLFPEFDTAIEGMKKSESKEITVHFPEHYRNQKLANMDISFQVVVIDIRKQILPEINDEFAQKLGRFNTLDELKQTIQKSLQNEYDRRADQEVKEQVFSKLLEKIDFEVPEAWHKYQLNNLMNEARQALNIRNMTLEDAGYTEESLAEEYKDLAEKQAKRQLLLLKIIEQENLILEQEEVDAEYEKIAQAGGQPVESIKKFYDQKENENHLESLRLSLLERKAMQMMLDANTINEVEYSTEQ